MKKILAFCAVFAALYGSVNAATLTLYYTPTCPFCHHAKDFINDHLREEFPDLNVIEINVSEQRNQRGFMDTISGCGLEGSGVPLIVIGETCLQGFSQSVGNEMREALQTAPPSTADEIAAARAPAQARPADQGAGGNISIFLMALAAIVLVSLGAVLLSKKK